MIYSETPIEVACADDPERPAFNNVCYDAGSECLIASDGFILACVPAHPDDDYPSRMLSKSSIEMARRENNHIEIDVSGQKFSKCIVGHHEIKHKYIQCKYPPVQDVLSSACNPGDPNTLTVSLDVDLLNRLSTALGDAYVTLTIEKDSRVITVRPYGSKDTAVGILMLLIEEH